MTSTTTLSQSERSADDDEHNTVLQLSRFAYKATLSAPLRPQDRGLSRSVTPLVRRGPPDHLSGPQLAQLSKCIGCGLEWTTGKTAKQKRTHIKQCAKKQALTKDTIITLVEKEIAMSSPAQNAASSHRQSSETTLLDSIVTVGQVKKSKRQQVPPTVKSLPETRESILSRARGILGPTNTWAGPQATQQFSQGALARTTIHRPKRHSSFDVNRSTEGPPSTQPFGVSSLCGETVTVQQSGDGCEEFPFLPFGVSLFAQDSVVIDDHKYKRSASSPPSPGNDSRRVIRRRLQ